MHARPLFGFVVLVVSACKVEVGTDSALLGRGPFARDDIRAFVEVPVTICTVIALVSHCAGAAVTGAGLTPLAITAGNGIEALFATTAAFACMTVVGERNFDESGTIL